MQGDAVVTDVEGVRAAVESCGADNVLCVVTTTSCFAPRLPDKVPLESGFPIKTRYTVQLDTILTRQGTGPPC